ncbi:sugar phosphate isomerase/epimerase and 4-hydroxyphenylpyruvate domain-containing protein [Micrococcoides hystricis]|uniref:3-dehydroshikimate dehydratase n=1 Tax=Micrococcoides hystricis TaxID=1572761 RepID=A0ABV6PCH3_9MICC
MKTSIATVCLSGTLEEKLHACSAAGFDGVEIFEQDLIVSPMSPEEIKALAQRLNLTLDLYQPFRDFEGVDEAALTANLHRAESKFRLMNRLGIDTILVCSNVATATINDDEVFVRQLRALGELASKYKVRIAYEALAWGRYVNTYQHSWEIVKQVDLPNVGLCLDSFHILSRGDDPADIADIPGEKIFFVQLADAPVLSMDILSWSRHYRVFPGEGGFQLQNFMRFLALSGYDGIVSLEIFNDVFRQSNVRRTAVDGLRSLIWLQDGARQLLAEKGETALLQMETLPSAQRVHGFDFAEVVTDSPEAVAETLAQLGFQFFGQHRRKPVQLWKAGNARIIINAKPRLEHSTEVAAFGIHVEQPSTALARAEALLAPRVARRQLPDEEQLAGIVAPDKSEVFLGSAEHSENWEKEFGQGTKANSLIEDIDHLNLAQPWQAFDESVLFYTSALNLQPLPATEVPSPMGLVRSQVLVSSNQNVRVALNIVPHGTAEERASHTQYPEHIAIRTHDVVTLAKQARAAGMQFLKVPANYYEDLASRFDLSDEVLAELEELNLLYDRDDDGEFLHFYTATIGDMFFEVVERRGGYAGYGAPNAPVRLAAQFERNRFNNWS